MSEVPLYRGPTRERSEREFFIDDPLVRIHFFAELIERTGSSGQVSHGSFFVWRSRRRRSLARPERSDPLA